LTECIGANVKEKWDGPAFGFFDDDEPAAPAVAPAVAAPIAAAIAAAPTASPKTASPAKAKPAAAKAAGKPAPQKATAPSANRSPVQLSSAMQPTVLVCDDEEDILEIIVELIQSAHPKLTIVTASDGRVAIEQVKKHKPHLIVTDLRMPNLNGLEFVAEVRKHDENVPVIFVSGFANRENIIEFVKLGVSDFLDKPIDKGRLSLAVGNGIKQSQTREGIVRLSSLNFKAYMTTLKLSQIGANQKAESDEVSHKVKNLLDEIAVLSNYILGL
jgi:CheY-like chemotaxis protein